MTRRFALTLTAQEATEETSRQTVLARVLTESVEDYGAEGRAERPRFRGSQRL